MVQNTLKFCTKWKDANELYETCCVIKLLPYLDKKCMRIAIAQYTRAAETKIMPREPRPHQIFDLKTMQKAVAVSRVLKS